MNLDCRFYLKRCVACGRPIGEGKRGFADHHCDSRYEAAVQAANRRAEEPRVSPLPLWARLAESVDHRGT